MPSTHVRAVCLVLLLLAPLSFVHAQSISLGMRVPMREFMWQDGKSAGEMKLDDKQRLVWQFQAANLDQMRAWGGEWNIVIARQWRDGPDGFARLRRILAEHERRGVQVVLRLLEEPSVYGRMQATQSAEYGHDQAYYQWVQSVVRACDGKVRDFLIGNEADVDLTRSHGGAPDLSWPMLVDYDQYARLLRTAVKAIKALDPGLQVANSGFSDNSVALAMVQDLYDRAGLVPAQSYWESWKDRAGVRAEGWVGLYRLLRQPETRRKIEFVRRALREPEGSDLFQLHYYRNWQGLQPMLDWLRDEMRSAGVLRPIIAAEVGYHVRPLSRRDSDGKTRKFIDWRYYSEQDHANDMVRVFATLLGNGVERALYWNMRDVDDNGTVVRLFPATTDPQRFEANRVNRAFRMLSRTLGGAHPAPARVPARAGLREFRFTGPTDVSLLWSEFGELDGMLDGARELRDIEGKLLRRSDIGAGYTDPLYVFW
ncbi:MAG: hypothetical protein R3F42_05355 [Pseudomonadota bacterium]